MTQFKRIPVDEAKPVVKEKAPSERDQIRREYEEALQDAVVDYGDSDRTGGQTPDYQESDRSGGTISRA
jgi:hypothetical protein